MQRLIHALLCFMLAAPLHAQEVFSLYVPSEEEEVLRMLRHAAPREGDVVFDLGSGDGRNVIGAAKRGANSKIASTTGASQQMCFNWS